MTYKIQICAIQSVKSGLNHRTEHQGESGEGNHFQFALWCLHRGTSILLLNHRPI